MTIKDLLNCMESTQKFTITGGFDEYSFSVIVNVTTVNDLKNNHTEIEMMKINSYEIAKFYTMNDVMHITVYQN